MPIFPKRTAKMFHNDDAPTPYQNAKREWDNRIGSTVVQAANWRYLAFILALGLAGSVAWNVHIEDRTSLKPIVVVVDTQGVPQGHYAPDQSYRPTDAQMMYALKEFIIWTRARVKDPRQQRTNWINAYAYVTKPAAAKLNDYFKNRKPLDGGTSDERSVDVSKLFRRSDGTWEAHWEETSFLKGNKVGTITVTGYFVLTVEEPSTEKQILDNPLGILIDDLNWNES